MIPEVLEETKVCIVCGDPKALSEFNYSSQKGKNINTCKKCRVDQKRERDRIDPYEHKRRTRNSNLKRKFGITLDDYEDMLFAQGGRCLICDIYDRELTKELCVDHNHETGKIRGLLCNRCNTLVGFLEKNKDLLSMAFNYIKEKSC